MYCRQKSLSKLDGTKEYDTLVDKKRIIIFSALILALTLLMAGILYNFYDKDYEFTSSVDWSETVYTQVELKTKADNIAISLEHDTFEDLIQYLDIAEGTNYGTRSFEEQVKLLGDYIGLTSYDKMDGS